VHRAFRYFVALVALTQVLAASADDMAWRFPSDRITTEQWQTFRHEVLAKPGATRQEFANQLVVTVSSERRIYVFTQPDHPAHPAVIVRAVVERGQGSEVQRMGHYAGDQKAFDAWWHQFDALDAKIPGQP
jgi:hypothetical protein